MFVLKKLVLLLVIIFGALSYYQKEISVSPSNTLGQRENVGTRAPVEEANSQTTVRFRCDGRQYCSQMTSRAEAEYFTRSCPDTKMDGDHDGIPCENDSRF